MNTWTTIEGKVLNISDMETSHINNYIKMLNKSINKLEIELRSCYRCSMSLIGEMAQIQVDNDLLILKDMISQRKAKINMFKKELERR